MSNKSIGKKTLIELLENTAHPDPAAVRILQDENERLVSLIIENANLRSSDDVFLSIMYGMGEYIERNPAPPKYRQRLWATCNAWIKRIADALNVNADTVSSFESIIPQPVVIINRVTFAHMQSPFRLNALTVRAPHIRM